MTKASGIDIEPPCGNSAGEENMIEYRTKQEGDFSYALPASASDSPESPPTRPTPAAGQAHHERAATGQARSHHREKQLREPATPRLHTTSRWITKRCGAGEIAGTQRSRDYRPSKRQASRHCFVRPSKYS